MSSRVRSNVVSSPKSKFIVSVSAALAVSAIAQSTMAAPNINFFDSGGGADMNWSTAANWNRTDGNTANIQTPDVEPVAADSAVLNNGGTVLIDQSGEVCSRFQLGRSNYALTVPGSPSAVPTSNSANLGMKGTVNIVNGGQLIDSGAFDMGTYTVGGPQAATTGNALNVSGGALYTGEFIRVGVGIGSSATVTQTGGLISVATQFPGSGTGQLNIGDSGTGTVNVSGGTLAVLRQIVVGLNTPSTGNFNISGGTVSNGSAVNGSNQFVDNDFVVGRNAAPTAAPNGTVTQTGGSVTSTGRYSFGFVDGSSGQATHSGGTLQVGQMDVGRIGRGAVTLNGTASVNVNSITSVAKFVGATVPSNGTLTVGGTASLTTAGLVVGQEGNGVLNFNSGTINVTGVLQGAGSPAGEDNAEVLNLLIGRNGEGTVRTGDGILNHSAGALNVATNLIIGDFDDSNGVYNISGGTLTVTGNANIGSALASNAPAVPADTQGQAVGAKGTLHVIGNAATINIGGKFIANPGDRVRTGTPNQATLIFDVGSVAGTSLINVGGVADIDGAVVNMNLTGTTFVPEYQSTFTLLTAASFGATGTGSTQNNGTGSAATLGGANAADFTLSIVTSNGRSSLVATNQVVPGDTNNDKDVDFDDLVTLAQNYNATSTQSRSTGDFNRSGTTDFNDLVTLAQHYGFGVPQLSGDVSAFSSSFQSDWRLAQAIAPEPTSIALISGAALLAKRRRRSAK